MNSPEKKREGRRSGSTPKPRVSNHDGKFKRLYRRPDASQPPMRKNKEVKLTKNSPTKEKGTPNKVAHKESTQEVQKNATK